MAEVLVLEPYPEVAELIRRIVARSGHSLISESEAKLHPERVDLVVLEPALLRGAELTRLLKEVRPDLPIIVESLYHLSSDVEALAPAAFLMKPWTMSQLTQAIELALEGLPSAGALV